ncbi:hypothetical protein SSCG_02637 [Streptomyces clavuligerus]|nr:hypothetical protein SSCG_02637 [Streptomyces clavuligerus]
MCTCPAPGEPGAASSRRSAVRAPRAIRARKTGHTARGRGTHHGGHGAGGAACARSPECSPEKSDGLLLFSHLMFMKAGYVKVRRELYLMVLTRRFICVCYGSLGRFRLGHSIVV